MTARLLTTREAAELVGVDVETVLRWIRDGKLPAIRLGGTPGGRLRIVEDVLETKLAKWATPARGSVTHPAGRRPAGIAVGVTHPEHEE